MDSQTLAQGPGPLLHQQELQESRPGHSPAQGHRRSLPRRFQHHQPGGPGHPGQGAAAEKPPGLPAPGRPGGNAAVAAGQPGHGRPATSPTAATRGNSPCPAGDIRRQVGDLHFSHPDIYRFLKELYPRRAGRPAGAVGLKPAAPARQLVQARRCMLQWQP
ncbi:MAG: hypothetical protein MZV64_28780 [Ignavibacteriales bacterium]|nr:hypothetical protein [Ignavibacteriales bacterium]